MDKQIKMHDYLDIKSKDYYIGIEASGDQSAENLSGDNETSGIDFPRWGDHCHPAGYFPKISERHLIIPSGQEKATGVNVNYVIRWFQCRSVLPTQFS